MAAGFGDAEDETLADLLSQAFKLDHAEPFDILRGLDLIQVITHV
jgi:hypothetical protein